MLSLFFRNLFFTLLQPGLVAGLLPYWLIDKTAEQQSFSTPFKFYQIAGIILFFVGLLVMLHCIIKFAVEGKGTLSPADPTKVLVVHGLYNYSRNPMYTGVMLVLMGEAIFFRSVNLWVYSAIVFTGFNLFIILHEEPRLRKAFRKDYEQYCRNVKRWL